MTTPYVNPIGSGLTPARIDMGVDYTGKGQLYAMGSGTIENVYNSGWPGGKFISLLLDQGPYAGQTVYYAENITPNVKVGQKVKAGDVIGTAVGTYPYIEVGWAAEGGKGNAEAAVAGQAASGSDPGAKSTAYGVSMSNLIASLGGPAGIITPGGITGTVGAGYPQGSTLTASGTPTTTAASLGSGCVPLIGMVYLAVLNAQKLGRKLSRRQRRYRRRKDEKRH